MTRRKPKRAESEDDLTHTLNMRVSAGDMELLDQVSGIAARSIVGRAALRLGLEMFSKDPALLQARARPTRPGPKPRPRP